VRLRAIRDGPSSSRRMLSGLALLELRGGVNREGDSPLANPSEARQRSNGIRRSQLSIADFANNDQQSPTDHIRIRGVCVREWPAGSDSFSHLPPCCPLRTRGQSSAL
jgi:hypothetical protein